MIAAANLLSDETLVGSSSRGPASDGRIKPDIAYFYDGIGLEIYEGYGLTETTAASTVNTPDGFRRIGSVGRPLPGVETGILTGDGRIVIADVRGPLAGSKVADCLEEGRTVPMVDAEAPRSGDPTARLLLSDR